MVDADRQQLLDEQEIAAQYGVPRVLHLPSGRYSYEVLASRSSPNVPQDLVIYADMKRWRTIPVPVRLPLQSMWDFARAFGELLCTKLNAGRPPVICLCGSTQFAAEFERQMYQLTLMGYIVLSIGCNTHSDEQLALDSAVKLRLDVLHLYKIDLADEVLVLNVGGYIGESTSREIYYARQRGKLVTYLEPLSTPAIPISDPPLLSLHS